MGVQEPVEESFTEVPATPPGVRDLGGEDDLFVQTEHNENPSVTKFNNEFFKGILPLLPYKGDFDFLGLQATEDILNLHSSVTKKKNECCPTCTGVVAKDIEKLEKFVEECKKETEYLRAENESLKKELEKLRKHLYHNQSVKENYVSVSSVDKGRIDVLLKKKNVENTVSFKSHVVETQKSFPETTVGIKFFSVSLLGENTNYLSKNDSSENIETEKKKTVAQLRKEFFEKKFETEHKIFTSRNYLEIKPKENKDAFRSRLTVKVNPKPRIAETISKLTALSPVAPQVAPVTLFQRFEKTRVVWKNDFKKAVSF